MSTAWRIILPHYRKYGNSTGYGKLFCRIAVKTAKRQQTIAARYIGTAWQLVVPHCRIYGNSAEYGELFCHIAVKMAKRRNGNNF